MKRNDLIEKLQNMDESEYTREMIEGYCNHFANYRSELREKVLGEETLLKIGNAMKTMGELAVESYAETEKPQSLPCGMWLIPKKHRDEALRQKWREKVPSYMSVEECKKILKDDIGIDITGIVEKVKQKEKELSRVKHECSVPF